LQTLLASCGGGFLHQEVFVMEVVVPPSQSAVTFLFTDIEDSTRLWEHYPEAMREDLARHDALLHRIITGHGGYVFKTIGDAFCAAFPTALAAVQAAMEAQQALLQEVPQLRVRMAVHTGEAVARDGDYFGPALNRVARLLIAGHGGQVLLSRAAVERLGDILPRDTHLQALGEHRLRDLASKERIYQLQLPGLPDRFPPLNTLDVAFRRGLLRATVIAGVVIAVVTGLAIRANLLARAEARQRRIAQEGQRTLRRHLYQAEMKPGAAGAGGRQRPPRGGSVGQPAA
jgi:class 3 adenylate cyclase